MTSRTSNERIDTLDVLRGVATLGILVMNVQAFAMPEAAYQNPTVFGDLQGANGAVWLLSHLIADRKFMAIFSMLFGAGVLLFTRRAEQRGDSAGRLHVRRMTWLFVFGIAHAYVLWYGDILATYAICGLLVFPFRRMRPGRRFALGILVLSVASVLGLLAGRSFPTWPEEDRVALIEETWAPPPERLEEEIEAYRSPWADQMVERAPTAWAIQTDYLFGYELWRVTGLMLLGMSLFDWGVLSGALSGRVLLGGVLGGAAVGLPLTLLGVHLQRAHHWDPAYSLFYGWQLNYWASLPLALAWIGLVLGALRLPWFAAWFEPLRAVGRMAFTNYLLETVLCTAIFYGHGLGLFGRVDRLGQLGFVLVVWVVVLSVSTAWMRAFRFGPLEWLWRYLTYGRAPEFRAAKRAMPGG